MFRASSLSVWLALALLLLVGFYAAAGEPIPFYLEDEPVYTSSDPDNPGMLLDVVRIMAKELDFEPEVHFLPWKRAQLQARETPDAVIFPLARTPAREDSYLWLCPIMEVPVMFVSRKGGPIINSFEEARSYRGIGVALGTPQQHRLEAQGVSHATFTGQDLYRALANGRVQSIYVAAPEAKQAWKQLGGEGSLVYGKPLETLNLWIAANPHSTRLKPRAWREALARIRQSNLFQQRMRTFLESP